MPGLVPGIHVLLSLSKKDVDGRVKPGHDDVGSQFAGCFIASSRSARRKILPTGVFGSSLRNSM